MTTMTLDHVHESMERLREFKPEEGYYVAFSGGKDSQVILDLCREAGVKHDAHFACSTLDPPEVLRFIKDHYPDVKWERPGRSYRSMLLEKQFPPMRQQRWCCELIKEGNGKGRMIVTGVRWAESRFRRKRRLKVEDGPLLP